MRVGLLSDTHDRIPAITDLLQVMRDKGVTLVMHAGDYCSPFSLEPFNDLNMALLGIFGRNDGDQEGLKAVAARGMAHGDDEGHLQPWQKTDHISRIGSEGVNFMFTLTARASAWTRRPASTARAESVSFDSTGA